MLLKIAKEQWFSEIEVVVILTGIDMSLVPICCMNVPMPLNYFPTAASYIVRPVSLSAILSLHSHH